MRIQIPIYAVPSMIIIIIKNNNDMTSFEEINKKLKASILYIYIYMCVCVCVCVCEFKKINEKWNDCHVLLDSNI